MIPIRICTPGNAFGSSTVDSLGSPFIPVGIFTFLVSFLLNGHIQICLGDNQFKDFDWKNGSKKRKADCRDGNFAGQQTSGKLVLQLQNLDESIADLRLAVLVALLLNQMSPRALRASLYPPHQTPQTLLPRCPSGRIHLQTNRSLTEIFHYKTSAYKLTVTSNST